MNKRRLLNRSRLYSYRRYKQLINKIAPKRTVYIEWTKQDSIQANQETDNLLKQGILAKGSNNEQ